MGKTHRTYKAMYQTECRHPIEHPRWREDETTGAFNDREEAIEDALKMVNTFPGWQYRVVRFNRASVEVMK